MRDPRAVLTPPEAEPLIPPAMDTFLHVGDLISLGHWALVAIDKMGGPNIAQEVGEWFAGDWSEVSRSADALRRLGEFCDVTAQGINADLEKLRVTWDGNAADAASTYFLGLADSLAAGAASSATVVGGILGAGGAGYSLYRGGKVVKEILEIRAKVWVACEALLGLIAGSLSSIEGFSTVELPGAYNNTQVRR